MSRREDSLIAQIEKEALDETASLAGALRKCVVLGGKSGSEQLRDWATRELKGYHSDAELPSYRIVPAQICIDGATTNALVTGQPIARSILPDFVQENVGEDVELREGAGALEALAARAESTGEAIKMSLPMGGDIARLMTAEMRGQQVLSVYWALTPPAVRGVLDQIRTALAVLVAELRATTASEAALPSAEAADHAVNVVVTGERHTVSVNTARALGAGASAATGASDPNGVTSPFWNRSRRIGAFVVGAATVAGAVVAIVR